MTMKLMKELMVSTGEYQKDGETKKRWAKVGVLMQDDVTGSMSVLLEVMPMPKERNGYPGISIACFDPKPRDNQQGQQQSPQQQFQQAPQQTMQPQAPQQQYQQPQFPQQ
jgi:hypothetical protein